MVKLIGKQNLKETMRPKATLTRKPNSMAIEMPKEITKLTVTTKQMAIETLKQKHLETVTLRMTQKATLRQKDSVT
jgi:hypothetical protein